MLLGKTRTVLAGICVCLATSPIGIAEAEDAVAAYYRGLLNNVLMPGAAGINFSHFATDDYGDCSVEPPVQLSSGDQPSVSCVGVTPGDLSCGCFGPIGSTRSRVPFCTACRYLSVQPAHPGELLKALYLQEAKKPGHTRMDFIWREKLIRALVSGDVEWAATLCKEALGSYWLMSITPDPAKDARRESQRLDYAGVRIMKDTIRYMRLDLSPKPLDRRFFLSNQVDCSDKPAVLMRGTPMVSCDGKPAGSQACLCLDNGPQLGFSRMCAPCETRWLSPPPTSMAGALRQVVDRFGMSPKMADYGMKMYDDLMLSLLNFDKAAMLKHMMKVVEYQRVADSLRYGSKPFADPWRMPHSAGENKTKQSLAPNIQRVAAAFGASSDY